MTMFCCSYYNSKLYYLHLAENFNHLLRLVIANYALRELRVFFFRSPVGSFGFSLAKTRERLIKFSGISIFSETA